MKKIILSALATTFLFGAIAQDAADKEFQAGIVAGFGMNFQKMSTKLITSDGAGTDLTIGANMNFMFTETIGLCTGIEFDFNTTKYKTGSNYAFYLYNDNKIEEYVQANEEGVYEGKELYRLSTRKQKATYLMIPTMLIFRTNFIGYFRYFGKFGLRSGFLLTQKIYDEGYNYDPESTAPESQNGAVSNNENMEANNEMVFFKSAVGLSGGAEWNFTGSTCLVAEIGYYYGITPLYNKRRDKEYLFTAAELNGNSYDEPFANDATQSQLMLKVSVLF